MDEFGLGDITKGGESGLCIISKMCESVHGAIFGEDEFGVAGIFGENEPRLGAISGENELRLGAIFGEDELWWCGCWRHETYRKKRNENKEAKITKNCHRIKICNSSFWNNRRKEKNLN